MYQYVMPVVALMIVQFIIIPTLYTFLSSFQRGILATEDGYLYIEPSGVAPDNLHTNKHQHHIYYTNHPIDHNDNTATCGFGEYY